MDNYSLSDLASVVGNKDNDGFGFGSGGLLLVTEYAWNTAMNMMYSDYCTVATKYGIGSPEFYGDMAKAFLFDKDAKSPNAKMSAYYYGIVDAD